MATFPSKVNYATGDVLTATNMNDVGGAINLLDGAQYSAGKNKIMNGDFGINQRGFTSTTTTGTYGFDRWGLVTLDGTCTYSAQSFTPGTAPVSGYESTNYARLITTGQTLTTARSNVNQNIENVRTLAGQTATISFWAKAATGTPKIALEINQDFGTGGSPSTAVTTYAGQATLSTSWARYSLTVAVPSISGKTIGTNANSSSLGINLYVSAGTSYNARTGSLGIQSNTFDIWGVQVENGSTASAFQTASGSPAGELVLCQRYYWRSSSTTNYTYFPGAGLAKSTTVAEMTISNPVAMRTASPTIEYSNINVSDGITLASGGTLAISASTEIAAHITVTYASGLTAFRSYFLQGAVGLSYIGFSTDI